MNRVLVFAIGFLFPAAACADQPLRFQWKAGERHAYSVTHATTITETAPLVQDGKPETTARITKLTLAKRWDVKEVDGAGTATMTMTITAMKQEITRPVINKDGKLANESITMDSATPEGAKDMAEFLNKPILTAKIDARGGVVEAKSAGGDSAANRLQAELPFRVMLPEKATEVNATWEREFKVKLDPPLGTGERHAAKQTYKLRATQNGYAVIGVGTAFANPPTATADLLPLLPWIWEGDVFVHTLLVHRHTQSVSQSITAHIIHTHSTWMLGDSTRERMAVKWRGDVDRMTPKLARFRPISNSSDSNLPQFSRN